MEVVKNIGLGIFHGLWDSVRGMSLVLHIDDELHRLNAEKEAEKQMRQWQRQNRYTRTPSPTPSSAAAMEREEMARELALRVARRENADERNIESLKRKAEENKEQKPKPEKKVAKQVFKCCLLNGGFTWLSIIMFEHILLPTLKFVLTFCYGSHTQELHVVWGWLQSILSILFGMMWVLPIFLLSKIVSSLWFADIANAAYKVRKGRPQLIPNISKLVADFLFSMVVQALFLVQSMLINLLPILYIGQFLCFLHLCLLYSLYSFEYKWFNMGWELHRRLSYIENNWPYFLGFGLPLTLLTNLTNSVIVSSCIFSIFFPLFILSGNEARPIVGATDTPLRLFSPVIFVSNLFFSRPGSGTQKLTASKVAQLQGQYQLQQQQAQQHQARLKQHQQQQRQQRQMFENMRAQETLSRRYARSSASASASNSSSPERLRFNSGKRPLVPTPVHSIKTATPTNTTTTTMPLLKQQR